MNSSSLNFLMQLEYLLVLEPQLALELVLEQKQELGQEQELGQIWVFLSNVYYHPLEHLTFFLTCLQYILSTISIFSLNLQLYH